MSTKQKCFMADLKLKKQKTMNAKLLAMKSWQALKHIKEQAFVEAKIMYLLPSGQANTCLPKGTSQSSKGFGQVFWGEFDMKHCHEVVQLKKRSRIDRASYGKNSSGVFSIAWLNDYAEKNNLSYDKKIVIIKEIFVMAYKLKLQSKRIV